MKTSHVTQLLALLIVGTLASASAQDVAKVLASYPQFSLFASLMNQTDVDLEIQSRSSITVLLPDNGILGAYVNAHPSYTTRMVADVLRYHVLLQYFGGQELTLIPTAGYTVTTLYQTTGRANELDGFVNLTKTADGTVTVGPSTPKTPPTANLGTVVAQYPYNYSFIQINAVLEPLGLAAAQLAPTTPPTVAPGPAPSTVPLGSPIEPPTEPPTEPPVASPPVAEEPGVETALSSAYSVGLNSAALIAALALVATLL